MKRIISSIALLVLAGVLFPANAEITFRALEHRDTVRSPKYYFLGATEPGNTVTIDGEAAKVYKTGAFGKEYKLVPGNNVIKVNISDGSQTVEKEVNVFFKADGRMPERKYSIEEAKRKIDFEEFKERSFYVETLPNACLQYGTGSDRLGGSKMGWLNPGITLKVTGEIQDLFKVQLSENRFAYIAKEYVKPTPKVTRTVNSNNMSVFNNGKSDRISISFPERLPYVSWTQLDPTIINVDVYGAMNNSNWLIHRRDLGMIDYVDVQQPESDVFRIVIKLKEKYAWGYAINYQGNTLNIDIKHSPEEISLKGMVIGLDAGHGGNPGAISPTGIREADVNLSIVKNIKEMLEAKGAKVVLSRTDEYSIDMSSRRKIFLDNDIDLLVSIHNNAGGSPLVPMGTSTYYKYIQNRELAACLLDRMIELDVPNYGLTGNFNFALGTPTEYPNALVECLFMSSLPDEEKLADSAYLKKIAQKVVLGLEDYLKKVKKARQGK
ncbi:MAG: N-acetylmuramoyl-L-alanine amidase [Bacteroidales bacterium]|nr:N-acetylmuramoyl-L-alanine amidase [Candidatus Cacconaster merdequi]